MGGREGAADILAKLVHYEVKPEASIEETISAIPEDLETNVEDFGIWIDPIGNFQLSIIPGAVGCSVIVSTDSSGSSGSFGVSGAFN